MHARWSLSLGIALVACAPVAAGESASSYSLKELRAVARSVHPTLDSADAALEAAARRLDQARAYPNPGIVVGFGRGEPRNGGAARSENNILLVQPIELTGLRRWRARSAELRFQALEFDRVLAETAIDSTVARLVTTVLLEGRRAEIARESADVAARLHELLERRVDLGESSPLEALKARTEWFARRRDVVETEGALRAARSVLNLFCGERLSAGYDITETLEGPGVVELPADLRGRLQTGNPVLRRAAVAIDEAQAQVELAGKQVFPRFDIFAGHLTELDRKATSVGVGLTIPLWDRNRRQGAAAVADRVRATADAHALVIELRRALEQSIAGYRTAEAALRLHQEGWTASAAQALDIATFSFENGEASLLEVLDAQRSYLTVRSAEAESWASLALARADIERLLAAPLDSENSP